MGQVIYQWLDLVWLPVAWFVVARKHRWLALGFVVACGLTLRMQVELMDSIGFPDGMLPWVSMPAFSRGLLVYGVVIGLFLILAHFSKATMPVVFLAAAISIYIFAFCASMLFMLV